MLGCLLIFQNESNKNIIIKLLLILLCEIHVCILLVLILYSSMYTFVDVYHQPLSPLCKVLACIYHLIETIPLDYHIHLTLIFSTYYQLLKEMGITVLCHFRKINLMPVIICKNYKHLIKLYNEIFSNMTHILSHFSYIFY